MSNQMITPGKDHTQPLDGKEEKLLQNLVCFFDEAERRHGDGPTAKSSQK